MSNFTSLSSVIGKKLLSTWPAECVKFVKVFPYEYQRALKAIEEQKNTIKIENHNQIQNGLNGHTEEEPNIKDIEEAIQDIAFEQRKLDKILDKTR